MNDAVQYHSQIAARWESNYKSEVFSVLMKVVDELLAGRDLTGRKPHGRVATQCSFFQPQR